MEICWVPFQTMVADSALEAGDGQYSCANKAASCLQRMSPAELFIGMAPLLRLYIPTFFSRDAAQRPEVSISSKRRIFELQLFHGRSLGCPQRRAFYLKLDLGQARPSKRSHWPSISPVQDSYASRSTVL